MLAGHNPDIDLTLVGHLDAGTGVGLQTQAFLACLDQRLEVSFHPAYSRRRPEPAASVECGNVAIFADLFCDTDPLITYAPPVRGLINLALGAFCSDRLPDDFRDVLQTNFDALVVPTPEVKEQYVARGFNKPIFTLPLALRLRPFLALPTSPHVANAPFRVGSISTTLRRTNYPLLIASFLRAFGPKNPNVELVIHTDACTDDTYTRLQALVHRHGATNIILSLGPLSPVERIDFLASIDILTQMGDAEYYGTAAQQALALGKPCILTGVPQHRAVLCGDLATEVPARLPRPAIYEEFGGRSFGCDYDPYEADVAAELRHAFNHRAEALRDAAPRKLFAEQFSADHLQYDYQSLVKPLEITLGDRDAIVPHGLMTRSSELFEKYALITQRRPTLFAARTNAITRKVIVGHDAGFFSLFNVFFTYLVWYSSRGTLRHVLPDWRVDSMVKHLKKNVFQDFCYGQPEDGNIWLKVFEPLYDDVPVAHYHDDELLYQGSQPLVRMHNADKEPLLTGVRAADLYRRPDFARWRRWYNYHFKKRVRVTSAVANEVDAFYQANLAGHYCISAQVRHPSHGLEQRNGRMPQFDGIIAQIRAMASARSAQIGSDWKVFLATDQQRAVTYFQEQLGDRVVARGTVDRTTDQQDSTYDRLPPQWNQQGHQAHQLVAADRSLWSHHQAEDVLVDALLLAKCNVLFHSTSNIATAVSFMEPNLEMVFCEG